MIDQREHLKEIKRGLGEIRKEIQSLASQCNPPTTVEALRNALESILGNVRIVMVNGHDPACPLLPWIKQRCETALKEL
jgi:hypothetical protein